MAAAVEEPPVSSDTAELAALKEEVARLGFAVEFLESHLEQELTRFENILDEFRRSQDQAKALCNGLENNRIPVIMQTINQVNHRIDQSRDSVLSVIPTKVREELDVKFPPYINRLNSLNRKIETLTDTIGLLEEKMMKRGIKVFIYNLITQLVPGYKSRKTKKKVSYLRKTFGR